MEPGVRGGRRRACCCIAHRQPVLYVSTGLMSTTGVPSMASRGPTCRRFPSIARTVTVWRPNGFGLSGERVAKTPVRGCARRTVGGLGGRRDGPGETM